ncbi:MAG: ATP-binding cassette domain-containing protein [Methylococcales bacterium]|nr:ATP-binding cassette domain-containing protein [Methylococcales bacterium]
MQTFSLPNTWRKPEILISSLLINTFALALPFLILQVYDRIIPNQALDTFMVLIIGMLVIIISDCFLKTLRSTILSWESAKFDHEASLDAMNQVLHMQTLSFETKPAGYYIDKIYALEKIQEFYSGQSILLLMDFPFALIFLILIWVIAGPLIAIPLVLLVIFLLVSIITGKKLHQALLTRSTMEDRRQNFIIEILQSIHTVKSMAMEAFMLRRYEKLQLQSAESIHDLSRLNSIVQGIAASFSQLAVISFVGFGSIFVVHGDLTIGALAAGTMLTSRALQPGLKAMNIWIQFQSVRLALDKVNELFSLQREATGDITSENKFNGLIEIDKLSFKFPGQEKNVLDNLSLTIKPGESIGISGNNGAGKSTFINLLSGFLEADSGQIKLDGYSIEKYNAEFLRSQIGIVPQKGVLVEGTILENMTLYREDEATDDAIELSKLLGLEDIIARMPDGLDTFIGGAALDNIPEGVKQKIIMVRSLIGHPKIILFDDANANFDIKNDNRLQHVIKLLQKQQKTFVIVSHRPSFLRLCDKQYTLENGQLSPAKPI